MGVRDLSVIIKRYAPSSVQLHPSLSAFAGQSLAIDANLLTAKFHYAGAADEEPHPHKHVKAWHGFLTALRKEGIKPIVVFDGDTRVEAKKEEVRRRVQMRMQQRDRGAAEGERSGRLLELRALLEDETASVPERDAVVQGFQEVVEGIGRSQVLLPAAEVTIKRLVTLKAELESDSTNPIYSLNQRLVAVETSDFFENLATVTPVGTDEDRTEALEQIWSRSTQLGGSHTRRSLPVPHAAYREIVELVEAMGIPWFKPSAAAPHEAEGICAALFASGRVSHVVSEDTDVAVYGAPLLRKVTTRSLDKQAQEGMPSKMNVLDAVLLKRELGLSQLEFLDLALLCGTDFTQRLPGLGPVRAIQLIRQYRTIEDILLSQTKYQPNSRAEYLATVDVARSLFTDLPLLADNAASVERDVDPYLSDLLAQWDVWSPREQRGLAEE